MPSLIDEYDGKINAIKNFVFNTCDAPFYLYVETVFKPFGRLVLALSLFGMDDVIRGYFRPNNLRTRRHKRRGSKFKPKGALIPELGEAVAKKIPGQQAAAARQVTQGVKNLWILDGALQRVLWYWLLIDVVIEFGYAWSSALIETAQCQWTFASRFAADVTNFGTVLGVAGWQTTPIPNVRYQRNGAVWNTFAGSLPAGRYQAVCQYTVEATGPSFDAVLACRITTTGPDSGTDESGPVDVPIGSQGSVIATRVFNGPADIFVEVGTFSGNGSVISADIFCIQLDAQPA